MEQELSGTIITCTKGGESRTGSQLGQPRGAQVAAGRHRDRAPAVPKPFGVSFSRDVPRALFVFHYRHDCIPFSNSPQGLPIGQEGGFLPPTHPSGCPKGEGKPDQSLVMRVLSLNAVGLFGSI